MSVQDEFNAIPDELKPKVIKKFNKIIRWIGHSGGMNDVWLYALNLLVFKAYEDMGYNIVVTPMTESLPLQATPETNDQSRILLTDF